MLSRVAPLTVVLSGVVVLATSFLPGWVDTERVIVGYGSARIVWSENAWAGFFLPWLPGGILLAALAAAAILASRGRRTWHIVGTAFGLLALGSLAVVGAIGGDTLTPNAANTWDGRPGPLLWLGIGLSTAAVIGGMLTAMADRPARRITMATGLLMLAVVIGACSATPSPSGSPPASPGVATIPDWRTDPDEPYPFTTPIPALVATDLDGEFLRAAPTDTYTGTRAHCVRCPPFPADRGISTLTFDRGRYEILHEEPTYRSSGHFVVEGETLTVFNDPECASERGTYGIQREGAELRLELIDDPCGFGRRGNDLTALSWTLTEAARGGPCQPPNTEAAISGHWPVPSGC
jgi:hypothetical protein